MWVPKHMGIDANETADLLAKQRSSHPLRGTEPTFFVPAKIAREVIRDWTSRKNEEHWQTIC
jgi:hypothetical protein